MKTVQLAELSRIAFDIHDTLVIDHHWRNGEIYTMPEGGRPDNGIMLLSGCDFEYMDGSEVIDRAGRGSLVYSPIGSRYSCRFSVNVAPTQIADYLINFRLFTERGEEFRLSDDRLILHPANYAKMLYYFERISSLKRKAFTPMPQIKSLLYELLCELSLEQQKQEVMSRRFAALYPAINYLRSTDLSELEASCLASLCHISDTCLRRLFREYFGMSPVEYITRMKLEKAEERLSSGMMTVAEVAESLGFSDASYFSRVYKRATGRSPRDDMAR